MAAYMITYDLNAKDQKYTEVRDAIKESSIAWCNYWDSTFLIKSNLIPDQINEKITPHLDPNDRLLVIEVKNNYQGWMADEDWKWIRENIFN